MTVSTNYNFNQSVRQMNELQTSISKTQTQIATGQQLTKPSDDPAKVTAIGRLNSALARQASYSATLTTVGDRLSATEASVTPAIAELGCETTLTATAAPWVKSMAWLTVATADELAPSIAKLML